MTPEQQKALEALQALHAENERLGLYKDAYAQSMTTQTNVSEQQEPVAVYGYCPECGAKGVIRERRLNGNDICAIGHTYPSRETTTPPPVPEAHKRKLGMTDEEFKNDRYA